MNLELNRWMEFWAGKKTPLHRNNSTAHNDLYGRELKLLLPQKKFNSVLELGCGTGLFYERLNFSHMEKYLGIDISQSMLNEFSLQYSEANLQLGSAHNYCCENRQYDIIFSNALVQYFTLEMLEQHLVHAESMLTAGGRIIHASIPWAVNRSAYRNGLMTFPYKKKNAWLSVTRAFIHWLCRKKDPIGSWYHFSDINKKAFTAKLKVEFYGSMLYPYRFHAVFTRLVP